MRRILRLLPAREMMSIFMRRMSNTKVSAGEALREASESSRLALVEVG